MGVEFIADNQGADRLGEDRLARLARAAFMTVTAGQLAALACQAGQPRQAAAGGPRPNGLSGQAGAGGPGERAVTR